MATQFMELINSANAMIDVYFNQYYGDKIFFVVTAICFVYLFIICKELRYKFLLPIALILLVIMNPILYHFILSKVIYWRLFWMIPNVAIMAVTIIVLLNRQKRVWLKWCMLTLATVFVFYYGNNVFQNRVFMETQNWEKLYPATIEICDTMLELDDNPRAIVSQHLFTEIRQYAPEISMMYGRNAHGYMVYIGWIEESVFYALEGQSPPDYDYILSNAIALGYNFLIVTEAQEIPSDIQQVYGYEEVSRTWGFIVYYNEELEYVPEENT